MKIGILTYHCVPNFGAQLQALSTIGFFKKHGHEPVVLHWYPQDLEDMYKNRVPAEQAALHMAFAENNMPVSRLCRTENELIAEVDRLGIDVVFSGSDALFKYVPQRNRTHFSKKKLKFEKIHVYSFEDLEGNAFWGDFLSYCKKRVKAVAFSVSSQNCPFSKLNKKELSSLKNAMNNYSRITVRDEWTRMMVKKITGRSEIPVTPDPVFSFNPNLYLDLPSKADLLRKFDLPENYVLFSFRTKFITESYVNKLAQEFLANDLTPVAFPMPEGLKTYGLEKSIPLPLNPLEWFALIKYSKGYVGERMHPIVVSLHNANPFYCFDEYGTFKKLLGGLKKKFLIESSKTYHVLKVAGLEDFEHNYLANDNYLGNTERYPDCKDVVSKIVHFPIEKCKAFAERCLDCYNQEMNKILLEIGK